MKKLLFLALFCLVFGSTAYGGVPSVLEDGDGNAIGTSANPLKISLTGGGGTGSAEWRVTGTTLEPNLTNQGNNVDLSVGEVFFVDDSADRVGIGTTSPGRALEVVSTELVAVEIKRSTNADVGIHLNSGDSDNMAFGYDQSENAFVIAEASDLNSGGQHFILDFDTNDLLIDTNTLVVDASANSVGIGTTSPAAKLDVGRLKVYSNGDLSMDGYLTASGIYMESFDVNGGTFTSNLTVGNNLLANASGIFGGTIQNGSVTFNKLLSTDLSLSQFINDGNGSSPFIHAESSGVDFVEDIQFSSNITVNGSVAGGVRTLSISGSATIDPYYMRGGIVYTDGAGTITLPAITSGDNITIITIGAVAVTVDVNASDKIWLDGTPLDDGDTIDNTSTSGDIAVLTYFSADGWYASTNGWTDGGAT